MSQGPRRLIDDPEWGGAFEGLLDEQGTIEGLPDSVRADVAMMIAASVAGAVGVAAAGATASTLASAGSSAGATGSVSSMLAGSVGSASAAAGSSVVAGSSVAAVGSGVASAASVVTAASTMGAASASLAALGVVPKVIAALSLAGAMTVGGVAVVKDTQSHAEKPVRAVAASEFREGKVEAVPGGIKVDRRNAAGSRVNAVVEEPPEPSEEVPKVRATTERATPEVGDAKSAPEIKPLVAKTGVADGLAGEVSLLQQARSALSVNREYAWTLLTEYHRRYPEGALRSEYEALVRRVQTTPIDEPKAD